MATPLRFSLLTFGCRVNQAESQAIERELVVAGAEIVDLAHADLIVVNSCSVTATADQGTRQSIRRVARENPSARIVVTGCYATRAPADVGGLPGVVHVVPNARKDGIAEEALHVLRTRAEGLPHMSPCSSDRPDVVSVAAVRQGFSPADIPSDVGQGLSPTNTSADASPLLFYGNRTAFTLRVQTGCEESCSYCVIPSTRGAERSSPVLAIVDELRRVEAAGYKEVTLTGVHLGSYGRDLDPPASLDTLLGAVVEGTRRLRFRLGSLEPMDCTSALIERAASGDRLAPAFHLPLQHASDRVLRAMRRPYTCAEYDRVVGLVRARLPHASITADVIVGFPGETDADFEALIRYLTNSPLTQLHVFPYSDRPGTEAPGFRERVHGTVVRERARTVREVGARLAAAFRSSQAGTLRPALTIGDGSIAVTDNGLKIRIEPPHPRNTLVRVVVGNDGAGHATQAARESACTPPAR
jgi:threonylcarbamoyladenosine tRNA methylthiotransferase MtaB